MRLVNHGLLLSVCAIGFCATAQAKDHNCRWTMLMPGVAGAVSTTHGTGVVAINDAKFHAELKRDSSGADIRLDGLIMENGLDDDRVFATETMRGGKARKLQGAAIRSAGLIVLSDSAQKGFSLQLTLGEPLPKHPEHACSLNALGRGIADCH